MWVRTKPSPANAALRESTKANPTRASIQGIPWLVNLNRWGVSRHVYPATPVMKSGLATIYVPDAVADASQRETQEATQLNEAFAYLQYHLEKEALLTHTSPAVHDMNGDLTIPADAGT